jgi:hypothetical protein
MLCQPRGIYVFGHAVMGLPVPFHINFEEVNLRFYVKRETGDETRAPSVL